MPESKVLRVRVSTGVKSLAEVAAEAEGENLSAWIRRAIRDRAFRTLGGKEKQD